MAPIDKIYFYKMTSDNGGAPCSYRSVLTLAICKPKIRSTADVNDWIIGFGGKDLGERLIYIAQVNQKLYDGEYYKNKKLFKRPDCIYRWDTRSHSYYWLDGKKYHEDGTNLEHDLDNGKALVLLSRNYSYFGNLGTTDYKEKYPEIKMHIEGLKQGHRLNHSERLFNQLCMLIEESMPLKKHGKPSHSDNYENCNCVENNIIVTSRNTTKCI
ncbi:hypothetical protein ACFL6W_10630 [Thermodesulfobacteriota bacterium]